MIGELAVHAVSFPSLQPVSKAVRASEEVGVATSTFNYKLPTFKQASALNSSQDCLYNRSAWVVSCGDKFALVIEISHLTTRALVSVLTPHLEVPHRLVGRLHHTTKSFEVAVSDDAATRTRSQITHPCSYKLSALPRSFSTPSPRSYMSPS